MGAKKRKKQAKRIKKIMKKGNGVDWDDIVLAGLGTLSRAAKKDKRKIFTKAVKRGIDVVEMEIPAVDNVIYENGEPLDGSDPVISYSPHGGGWFNVEIDGQVVERVKGEEESATRAGELLEGFAAMDPEEQSDRSSGIFHTGGGWYTIKIHGVPVDRVRGEDTAAERMSEVEEAANKDN